MKSSRILVVLILIIIGGFVGFYVMKKKVEDAMGLNDDFFISVAHAYYNDSFSGTVSKKFIDWDNHGFKKIVLVNQSKTREVRLDYEWIGLFKFIQVGDSISKEKYNLDMRLKREELDTIIRLNFSGIENSWDYIDFLYELDSIYDK